MSYLGKVDMNDANIKHYSLTGSTLTVIPIGWTPASEQSLRVTINGVVQQGDTFSYSGSNLTLGGPLVVTDTLEVVGIQSVGNIITPADNSVTTTKLADDAVTLAKMAGGTDGNLITYDASGDPAYVATGAATNILTSNGAGAAPTFQAAASATLAPAFSACVNDATVSFSDATETKVTLNREIFDSDGAFDPTTNYRFTVPAGEGGKYLICAGVKFLGSTSFNNGQALVKVNGSEVINPTMSVNSGISGVTYTSLSLSTAAMLILAAADEVELWVYFDTDGGTVQYNGNATSQRTYMSGFKLVGI